MAQINPTVRLYVVTLDGSSQTTELRPPDSFEKRLDSNVCHIVYFSDCGTFLKSYSSFHSEHYITMVKWVGPESLSVRWVNRAQNMSILSLCNVVTGICTTVRATLWRNLQARAPSTDDLFTCLFLIFQKNVMTSEKWLDRQVSVPIIVLFCQFCCQTFVICLRCQYFGGFWTTAFHVYDVIVSRDHRGEGLIGKYNKYYKYWMHYCLTRMKSHYILGTTWHFSSRCP